MFYYMKVNKTPRKVRIVETKTYEDLLRCLRIPCISPVTPPDGLLVTPRRPHHSLVKGEPCRGVSDP